MNLRTLEVGALAIGALVVGVVVYKTAKAGAAVVGQVAATVDTAVAAPVLGIGDVLGIPRTNLSACEQAKAEGRTWDASFACPALDFMGYIVSGTNLTPATAAADVASASTSTADHYDELGNFIGNW